jgi:outer membrane protein
MRTILIGICAILMGLSFPASAQKYWSLEECIKYGQEKNIQIKRKELSTESSNNNLLQSRINLLPSVGAGFNHQLSAGRSLNTQDYKWENSSLQQGSLGIQAEIILFNGFQNINGMQKSKFDLMMSLSELDKAKNDVSLNIATAYLQVLFCEELLDVAKSQLEVSNLQVERNKKLLEVGNVARGNLLDIQAQAAREQVNVTTADNNLKIAYLALTQMLELDSVGDFKVVHPETLNMDDATPLQSVSDIYNQALTSMPEIKSSEYYLKSTEKQLAMNRGKLSPSLSMTGLYYSNYYNTVTNQSGDAISYYSQVKNNLYKQLAFNISIPIFNRYNSRTAISNSKIAVYDAEYNLTATKKVLYKSIQQAHADAVGAFENYLSRKEAVLSSEEAFKYTQQKYDVGMSSAVDYNIAKSNLIKAKSDLVQSKYEYIFKIKVLDFYKGAALKL